MKKIPILEKIEDYKDLYKGERCFILGNGPSLNETNLELLENEYSFALNQINLIYNKTKWRPSVFSSFSVRYGGGNKNWTKNINESINLNIPVFLIKQMSKQVDRKDVFFLNRDGDFKCNPNNDSQWSHNIVDKITCYGTTLMGIVEIVVYMGFNDIYLLGCDLGYDKDKINHFSPNYLSGLNNEYNLWINNSHKLMKRMINKLNKNIYNATIGGELEVYERVEFEDIIKNKKTS